MHSSSCTVLVVCGTRPEVIKLAPLARELQARPREFVCRVCLTGQHAHLLGKTLDMFDVAADHHLDIMVHNQSLHHVAATVISRLQPILEREQPDWVVVQGDTTTTLAATVAAHYSRVRVAHVEAGLRSGNEWHPFPEEINRRLVDHACHLHLAPTDSARRNLLAEGIPETRIRVTGNTVIDAVLHVARLPEDASARALKSIPFSTRRLVLVTAHRRENFGAPMGEIAAAIRELARRYASDVHFVLPVHPNPNVRSVVFPVLQREPNVSLLAPLEYRPFVQLLKRATLVLSDSGGIQEEGVALGIPVLLLREVTERPEGVQAGTVRVVGTRRTAIVEQASALLDNEAARTAMARPSDVYGDGRASQRTAEALLELRHVGTPDSAAAAVTTGGAL